MLGGHAAGAAAHFLLGGLGMLAMGLAWRGGWVGWISGLAGIVVVIATMMVGNGIPPGALGLVERVAAYGIVVWMVAAGWKIQLGAS